MPRWAGEWMTAEEFERARNMSNKKLPSSSQRGMTDKEFERLLADFANPRITIPRKGNNTTDFEDEETNPGDEKPKWKDPDFRARYAGFTCYEQFLESCDEELYWHLP